MLDRDKERVNGHVTLQPNIEKRGSFGSHNAVASRKHHISASYEIIFQMSENMDFISLVHEGEILAACRALYPTTHSVLNIQAERTTPPVPGFTSLMLRVNVTARSTDGTDTKEATLVLEDLNLAGFTSLVSDFKSICGADMSMAHVRLVVRKLAKLHAASLGIDWPAILPQLERDAFYDSDFGTNMMRPAIARSSLCIAATMKKFMDPATSGKHAEWMQDPSNYFNKISKLIRFTPGQVNVLCHGDCHANNLMFKHDEQGNPTEVKFVDLQMFRYAPPSRDLQHFLYSSTSREFREQHETEVLKTYVEAFNAAACTTPDVLDLDAFLAEYDAARMLGLGIEITIQPMKFITAAQMMAKPGDAMTSEQEAVPVLSKRCPQLPLVKSLYSQDTTLIMEDLTLAGYTSIVPGISKMCGAHITIAHVRLAVRSLAKLHAASLGADWHEILPQLEKDAFYDSDLAKKMIRPAVASGSLCLAMAMKKFMDPVTSRKHADWLLQGDNLFNEISKFSRFVPGQLNVLCHGDFHANNMMFRHDEQGNPMEVKLVDLQMFRYAPPTRDLLYFLYSSTSHEFRQQYEHEVLKTYVEAFNAAACTTPDLLNLDIVLADYDAARMHGLGTAITVQPLIYSKAAETMPNPGEPMTSEQFDKMMAEPQEPEAEIEQMLQENLPFREALLKLGEEVKLIYKRPTTIPQQLEMMGGNDLFLREVAFFRDAVPILSKRSPQLPLVKCLYSQDTTLIMEDLSEAGYSSILPDIREFGGSHITMPHVRLAVRSLARLHAASLAMAMKKFMDPVTSGKHADWLQQPENCFNGISKFARFVPGQVNVLCHGDFHANNMMFRHDEQGNPTEVKLVDLQMFRYAPPSRDLLYFLYSSTSQEFRQQHEHEVMDLLNLDTFLADYDAARMHGLGTAITVQPMIYSKAIETMPKPGEPMTKEQFEKMTVLPQDPAAEIEQMLHENLPFREAMLKLGEEVVRVLDKAQLGEILAACRALYPTTHSVLNIQAERTTPPVPGFTSLMLRVNVTARSTDGTDTQVKLIYKRPSIIPQQLEMFGGKELSQRDVAYFRDAVPILSKRCPQLPLVKCYYSQDTALVMEDLIEAGYSAIVPCVNKVIGSHITTPHVRLAVRSLARLHAASLGTDWSAILPHLETDAFYDSNLAKNMLRTGLRDASLSVSMAMKKFMDPATSEKHADWLLRGDNLFNEISKFARFDPGQVNVLCHGDFHVNNMMFRHDEHGNPTEVKFVDFQMFRCAPPTRDLLYFLYSSTSQEFRQRHEHEILLTYVETFNSSSCTTPDILSLDHFLADYDAARMHGLGIAIFCQKLLYSKAIDMMSKPGNLLTSEQIEKMAAEPQDPKAEIEQMLQENLLFREAMLKLAEEVIKVLDKSQLA
ncbi:hypothetical protein B566_EDAN009614 [Ephemera danica]|nr:hypothetical protein B566_EDAN009614 [Ephemera danica]